MKKFVLAAFVAMEMVSMPSDGVLPPLYQSLEEYKSLINDPHLSKSLTSGEAILYIKRDNDQFEVVTNKHSLTVQIVYDPQDRPGPAHYHLEFSPAVSTQ